MITCVIVYILFLIKNQGSTLSVLNTIFIILFEKVKILMRKLFHIYYLFKNSNIYGS